MSVIVSPSEEGERERVGPRDPSSPGPHFCSGPWWGYAQASGRGGGVIPEARVEAAWAGRADGPPLLALLSSLWEAV